MTIAKADSLPSVQVTFLTQLHLTKRQPILYSVNRLNAAVVLNPKDPRSLMSILSFFGANNVWQSGDFPKPWEASRESIYEDISNRLDRGEDLDECLLPDEERYRAGSPIGYVSGALDNLFGNSSNQAGRVVRSVCRILKHPDDSNIKEFYGLLLKERAIGLVGDSLSLIAQEAPNPDRLAVFFGWLVRSSPDREAVKFSIALLGSLPGDRFKPLFLCLGRHEEFTKYAAIALRSSLPYDEAKRALFELCRLVKGWGRIDLVEQLADHADAEFRHWLVRDGFRNSVMDEYLACIAARQGRLLAQLSERDASKDIELIDGAADIFTALVVSGPAETMDDYEDGATAVQLWLEIVQDKPVRLSWALAVKMIIDYATDPEEPPVWSKATATGIAKNARKYLARTDLENLVRVNLKSGSQRDFWLAQEIAPELGLDPWPFCLNRQSSNREESLWFDLMRTDDPSRIDQVVALAQKQIPLQQIASGPSEELGLGLEWQSHDALDFVLQDLDRFPGKGWSLIAAALRSPTVRNRNMAVKALRSWRKQDWPPDALQIVRQAIREEPDSDVRAGMERLLEPNGRN